MRNEVGGTVHGPVVQAGRIGTLTMEAVVPVILPGTKKPGLIPAPTRHFTDRRAELDRLTALLEGEAENPAPRVVVLTGTGGIGKSATALHFAARLRGRFDGGQLHADLRGDATATAAAPSTVLVRFLRALGVAPQYVPAEEQEQIDWFRTLTADRRLLTVLDNAHSVAQVLPLLPTGPGSLTLVTSRRRLSGLSGAVGAHHMALPPLGPADAALLLTRLAGREPGPAGSGAGAESVARHCGGLPLALCVAGERLAVRTHLTWEQLERDVASAAAHDRTGGPDGEAHDPVTAAVDTSYRDLGPDAARLYRLGGLRRWPALTAPAAAALVGLPEARAAELLEELASLHLVEEYAPDRYRYHDLLREDAARRAGQEDGPGRSAAAVGRLLRHHLAAAAAADRCVIPDRWRLGPAYARLPQERPSKDEAEKATEWLLAERENLVEAVRAADEYGLDDLTWQLCEALWSLFLRQGFHQDWLSTHRLGVRAAAACPDIPEAEGRMHAQLGFALLRLGRHEEAEAAFRSAAEADRRCGHRRGEATAVESLGLVRLAQGRFTDAADSFRAAQDLAEDPRAQALLVHHLGRALSGQGRHADAADTLERARSLMVGLPDPYNEARVLTSLGEAALAAGDRERAAALLTEAAERMASQEVPVQEADIAALRAKAAATPAERRGFLTEAIERYERLGSPEAAALRAERDAIGQDAAEGQGAAEGQDAVEGQDLPEQQDPPEDQDPPEQQDAT
ncbi:tetratricopeptide repeat protein [Streptomyces sp. NPDC094032]|uniref:tetratricopeptide repeat protein n=1 Tax=Streptomyces sp. NPDC094032 TaxID=3155308 RepID=UPI003316C663